MDMPLRRAISIALVALVPLSACDAPPPIEVCGQGEDAFAMAMAAQVRITTPVSCADLLPGSAAFAGCESPAPGAVTSETLTCAAISPERFSQYPACQSVGPAAAHERFAASCKTVASASAPDFRIEVGTLDGPVYLLRTNDQTLAHAQSGSSESLASTQTNPNGTRTVETTTFTATYGPGGDLRDVTWR